MTVTIDMPRIETERLRFRLPALADFEDEAAFYASPRAAGVGGPRQPHEVFRGLAGMIGHWVLRGYGFYAIEDKSTGRYCGRVGLWYPLDWPEPEIGWTLMAHAEGRGLAYEAALAVLAQAYKSRGWTTVISLIAPGNTRSQALARRLGARLEGHHPHPEHGPIEIWRHPGPGK